MQHTIKPTLVCSRGHCVTKTPPLRGLAASTKGRETVEQRSFAQRLTSVTLQENTFKTVHRYKDLQEGLSLVPLWYLAIFSYG